MELRGGSRMRIRYVLFLRFGGGGGRNMRRYMNRFLSPLRRSCDVWIAGNRRGRRGRGKRGEKERKKEDLRLVALEFHLRR